MLSVKEAFQELPDKVHFLGGMPFSLSLDPNKYVSSSHVDALLYWKQVYMMAPKVFLFPLVDCFFNRAKSNICMIEALHAGALCVAPDLPEWRKPGVITYEPGNSLSFLESAIEASEMTEPQFSSEVDLAFNEMRKSYDIEAVNQIRIAILSSMFNPSFVRNERDPLNSMFGVWALSVLKETALPRVGETTGENQ